MEAKELRIGNLIQLEIKSDQVYEVCEIKTYDAEICHIRNISDAGRVQYHSIYPIPLTEEWLLKLGFDKVDNEDDIFYQKGYIRVSRDAYESQLFYFRKRVPSQIWKDNVVASIKYVHELQNLTYVITKEELKL